jgi:hypothetical protein
VRWQGWCGLVVPRRSRPIPGSIYTCVDKQGRKLTADRPIPECLDREQRELSPTGTVRRQIGPSLTEPSARRWKCSAARRPKSATAIEEERRRERVLVARYPDKAAHDAERAAAIAQLWTTVTATAEKRIAELQAAAQDAGRGDGVLRKDPNKAPMLLRRQIAENDEGVPSSSASLPGQDQEKRRIHQRFDAELAQLRRCGGKCARRRTGAAEVLPAAR